MGSLSEAYELRAKLRQLAVNSRIRDCGRRAIAAHVELVVRDYKNDRRAWWKGLLRCGRQHACPVCASRRAAQRAEELDRMMRGDDGRWQMVTLTLPHRRGQGLKELQSKLFQTLRRVRAARSIRKIFDARVTASVRALEVTHGKNGWHPHVHLLLRTEAWSDSERAELERAWCLATGAALDVGVVWSTAVDWTKNRARYLCKLGAEVAGIAKEPKNGNRTPWQIAKSALTNAADAKLWREYQLAMSGRRVLEMDERAKALLDAATEPEKHVAEWVVPFYSEQFRCVAELERRVPTILYELIESALTAGPDPPRLIEALFDDLLFEAAEWSDAVKRAGQARPVLASGLCAA